MQRVYLYTLVDEPLWKGDIAVGNISTQLTYSSQTGALCLMKREERSMEAQRAALPTGSHFLALHGM